MPKAATIAMPPPPPDPQQVIRHFVSILTRLNTKKLPPARPRRIRKSR